MTTKYVLHNGQTAAVKSRNAGWFTLLMPDGSVVKARGCKVISQEYSSSVKTAPAISNEAAEIVPTHDQAILIAGVLAKAKGTPKEGIGEASSVATPAPVAGRKAPAASTRVVSVNNKQYTYGRADVKTAAGNLSFDCGDRVAQMLRGKVLDAVYLIVAQEIHRAAVTGDYELRGVLAGASTVLDIEKALRNSLSLKNINAGRQRMRLGNLLRCVYRSSSKNTP